MCFLMRLLCIGQAANEFPIFTAVGSRCQCNISVLMNLGHQAAHSHSAFLCDAEENTLVTTFKGLPNVIPSDELTK